MSLKDELDQVDKEIRELEDKRMGILRKSLDAPEEDKIAADFMIDDIVNGPKLSSLRDAFPVQIRGIGWEDEISGAIKGWGFGWVKVRPVGEDKTYLGIYIGDLPTGVSCSYNRKTEVLIISGGHKNPAIVVPELKKIVFGYQSWWTRIESPEDLKGITDETIKDQWYVRLMKDLFGSEAE